MNRVVSHLQLKALDDRERILEGWASRPEADRVGDVVESKGAVYRLPLPLLMDHDHRAACGEVFEATVTDEGIRFKAKIANIAEPGAIKDLCDSAWSAAVAGLRRAVSIGFRPLDVEPLPTGGMRFKAWEWFELSLVAVPACAGATLDQIKAIDRELRHKHRPRGRVVKLDRPPARVVRLDDTKAAPGSDGPVVSASLKTFDQIEGVLEDYRQIKEMGLETYRSLRITGALAGAADKEFEEIKRRLAQLESR